MEFFGQIICKMQRLMLFFLMTLHLNVWAQTDTSKPIEISGYAEMYYAYDFNNPSNHELSGFLYNHKRHNEVNVNLAFIKAAYADQQNRANLAMMVGNYAQYNLAAEPNWAQFVFEANLGFRISNKHNLWIDAGILPSHIGFESAVGADCATLTRSLLAENTPYFESGAKLTYTSKSEKLFISVLYLNGWQQIVKSDFMHKPAFGMQFNYKINNNTTFNYSNFAGTMRPDSVDYFRLYHNFYLLLNNDKLNCTLGMDLGSQSKGKERYWVFSPVAIAQYKINKKLKMAARVEYYDDKNQIIIAGTNPNGFKVLGTSLNLDKQLTKKLCWRLEAKRYWSEQQAWAENKHYNTIITTAVSMKF
jgi:hypothetical protein